LIFEVVPMHITAKLTNSVQLAVVKHLAEFLELVLYLRLHNAIFLVKHALKGVEISGILYKTGDVDLSANEVAEITSGVEKRRLHEQVHER
jgi:hypothetical protein